MTCGGALCRHDPHPQLGIGDALCHPVQELQLDFLHAATETLNTQKDWRPT